MHELTEKVRECFGYREKIDSVITDYLREKAEEIKKAYGISPGSQFANSKSLMEILGLTEEPKTMKKDCELDNVYTPVAGWITHKDWTHIVGYPCSICQSKPSLRSELAEKLKIKADSMKGKLILWSDLADIALAFLKDHQGEL